MTNQLIRSNIGYPASSYSSTATRAVQLVFQIVLLQWPSSSSTGELSFNIDELDVPFSFVLSELYCCAIDTLLRIKLAMKIVRRMKGTEGWKESCFANEGMMRLQCWLSVRYMRLISLYDSSLAHWRAIHMPHISRRFWSSFTNS